MLHGSFEDKLPNHKIKSTIKVYHSWVDGLSSLTMMSSSKTTETTTAINRYQQCYDLLSYVLTTGTSIAIMHDTRKMSSNTVY